MGKTVQPTNLEEVIAALQNPEVTELDCRFIDLGDEEITILAELLPASQVTNLQLGTSSFGHNGISALAAALPHSPLTSLSLTHKIEPISMQALADALPCSQLKTLDLFSCNIGSVGARILAGALPRCRLTELNIRSNEIGNAGAKAIINALPFSHIRHLDMTFNLIGDSSACTLADVLPASLISDLNISYNLIGDRGAQALAAALPFCQMTTLYIGHGNISDTGAQAFAKAAPTSQLTTLGIGGNDRMSREEFRGLATLVRDHKNALQRHSLVKWPTQEHWQTISQNYSGILTARSYKIEDGLTLAIKIAEEALAADLPVRDFILKVLPFDDAQQWLAAHGQKISSVTELLNPDGIFPQDRFVCQQGMYALLQHPDLWESRAQAETAIRSLPEALQTILPTRQLLATLSKRDAAKQQGRI